MSDESLYLTKEFDKHVTDLIKLRDKIRNEIDSKLSNIDRMLEDMDRLLGGIKDKLEAEL